MSGLYLSRLRLNHDAPAAALSALLDPDDRALALDAHHRLLWTLFSDGRDRRRDFLWRANGRGDFYVLSRRTPSPSELFHPPETRPFEPALSPGDRLSFMLRANATRDRTTAQRAKDDRRKDRRVDIVMDALRKIPVGEQRSLRRNEIAEEVALAWMTRQGDRNGFSVNELQLEGYEAVPLLRAGTKTPRDRAPRLGIVDVLGDITVTDPNAFLERLAQGFGRAKAFGCGLMLIRRV